MPAKKPQRSSPRPRAAARSKVAAPAVVPAASHSDENVEPEQKAEPEAEPHPEANVEREVNVEPEGRVEPEGNVDLEGKVHREGNVERGRKVEKGFATTSERVSAEVIALERAALDRWGAGDPSGFLEICADDVVYFDPFLDLRIDGLEALTIYYEAIRGQIKIDRYELLNPRVQSNVWMAVLTFNYVSYGGNENKFRWNCTEVYRKDPVGWRIIQTHWSFTNPKK